jgi:hypothetical protein
VFPIPRGHFSPDLALENISPSSYPFPGSLFLTSPEILMVFVPPVSPDDVSSFLQIFFYCHVSGCVFWYIVKHEHSPNNFGEQATWDDDGVDKPLSVAPPAVAYLTILYFLIISFASVRLRPGPQSIPDCICLWASVISNLKFRLHP